MQRTHNLLPSGFTDLLPPYAWKERRLRSLIADSFRQFGYEEISPPLVEFESSVIDKAELEKQTFRLLDAKSQRMMGIRADMTPQIARIAASRMQDAPLPLRLCYSGTCLRVQGEGLDKLRQVVQAGIEYIGVQDDTALIEILRCTQEALMKVGINDISLDITLPNLVDELLKEIPKQHHSALTTAIEQKDQATIKSINHPLCAHMLTLMDGVTLEQIKPLLPKLPADTAMWLQRVELIQQQLPDLTLTLDPLEKSGFGYYDGIGFSLFSATLGGEIGYGGRYIAHDDLPAYGLTLYLNPLIRSSKIEDSPSRCLVLPTANESLARDLREKGWHTIYSQAKSADAASAEAHQFNCSHILEKDEINNV